MIADHFNEALSVLKKFHINQTAHLLIGLHLVDTYPEHAQSQQNAVFESLQLKDDCFEYFEARNMVEKFSFSTFLNFLLIAKFFPLIAKFFPKKYGGIPYFLQKITNREEALAVLAIDKENVQRFIKYKEIYNHLNFFDLLREATLLLEEERTYDVYQNIILEKAESAEEFKIGFQQLLERKPKDGYSKRCHQWTVSSILQGVTPRHLSFEVYEMLLNYPNPDNAAFAKVFLKIASICEKSLRKKILDGVTRMQELNDDMRIDIMKLEIDMGEFEQAKQTFYSIKNPEKKDEAVFAALIAFIEKEAWDHVNAFFKEFHEHGTATFLKLIEEIAKKDTNRALNLAKSYETGYRLASCLTIIAKEQKNQKVDFLPFVFEARSLILSLVTSNEDASQALVLLEELLELQSDESKN